MTASMRIVGVLLAAGRGLRFGGDKLLAPLPHARETVAVAASLGAAAARNLARALPESVAVVRAGEPRRADALRAAGLRVVECARADEGRGASLACAVAATRDADGWVVALADMPWIAPATITAVADALTAGADIAAPAFRGARGHPVAFWRRHYAALAALAGDEGARSIVESNRDALALIAVDDPGVLADVDTPGDLARASDR
jgi:molybdenum cofactor cytidylyltransferase